MSNVLRPFGDFKDPGELAGPLHALAAKNAPYLTERNYGDIVSGYAVDQETAEQSVIDAQRQHRGVRAAHFAVMHRGDVVGSAAIIKHSALRQLPSLGLLAVKLHYASPEIRAWVDVSQGNQELDALAPAYEELLVQSRLPGWTKANGVAWTIEPPKVAFNRAYHEAIAEAGLVEIDTRRYSNSGKSRHLPESTLYAALPGNWTGYSARAKEKALRDFK